MKVVETDLLWGSLDLNSLLEDTGRESPDQEQEKTPPKPVAAKHEQILKKPTYNAVMQRYQALPHGPKFIAKSKLDRLADPILGKLSKNDRMKFEKILSGTEELSVSPPSLRNPSLAPQRAPQPNYHNQSMERAEPQEEEEGGVFSLTSTLYNSPPRKHVPVPPALGALPEHSPLYNNPHPDNKLAENARNVRNGFALQLRGQVRASRKIQNLVEQPKRLDLMKQQPRYNSDQGNSNADPYAGRNGRGRGRSEAKSDRYGLPFQTKRGLGRKAPPPGSQNPSQRKGAGAGMSRLKAKDPLLEQKLKMKSIKSSGYGVKKGAVVPGLGGMGGAIRAGAGMRAAGYRSVSQLPPQPAGRGRNGGVRASQSTPQLGAGGNSNKTAATAASRKPSLPERLRGRIRGDNANVSSANEEKEPAPARNTPSPTPSLAKREDDLAGVENTSSMAQANTVSSSGALALPLPALAPPTYSKRRGVGNAVAAMYKRPAESSQDKDDKERVNSQGLEQGAAPAVVISNPPPQPLAPPQGADLQTTLDKLKQLEGAVASKDAGSGARRGAASGAGPGAGMSGKKGLAANKEGEFIRGEVDGSLLQSALRLSSNISNIENKLKSYSQLKEVGGLE